jgi:outer membrane protein OmpA-like peptidoglycan-associated protein
MKLNAIVLLICSLLVISKNIAAEDILPNRFAHTGYAQDRCCNSGCMVEVTTTKPALLAEVRSLSRVASVYFDENTSVLTQESVRTIQAFVEQNSTNADVTVIGRADGCGSSSHNIQLSERRASRVNTLIGRLNSSVETEVRWSGEISVGHSPDARRVDITTTSNVRLVEPLPKVIADFYLIDGSGSMNQDGRWEKWVRAISFHKPRGSRVFVATTQCHASRRPIRLMNPAGGTEIWYSYWSILDYMQAGQTLAVVSDFDSEIALSTGERQRLSQKARGRGIRVIAINL